MNPQFPADIGVASHSDVGLVRQANEDSYLVVDPSDPQVKQSRGQLVIVADGMGGHVGGATASRIVVETVATTYMNDHQTPIAQSLGVAVEEANRAVHAESQRNLELHKMGSTCTALVIHQGFAYLAHVGDSRCYLVRNGQLQQLTVDHSKVGLLVASGMITPEEAETHPEKNVILRSMGPKPHVDVDILPEPFQLMEGDRLVLCSDGLNAHVRDPMIAQMVQSYPIEEATRQLVEAAKMGGGTDNITVAVVRVGPDIPAGVRTPSPVPLSQPKPPSSSSNNDQMRVIGGIVIGMLLAALLFMAFSGGDSKESGDGDESQDDVVHSDNQGSENPDTRDPLADRELDEDPLPDLQAAECPVAEMDDSVCEPFLTQGFDTKEKGRDRAVALTACNGWEEACADGEIKNYLEEWYKNECAAIKNGCSPWAKFYEKNRLPQAVLAELDGAVASCLSKGKNRRAALSSYRSATRKWKNPQTRNPSLWEKHKAKFQNLCANVGEVDGYIDGPVAVISEAKSKKLTLQNRIEQAAKFQEFYSRDTQGYEEMVKLHQRLLDHQEKLRALQTKIQILEPKAEISDIGPIYKDVMSLTPESQNDKDGLNRNVLQKALEKKLVGNGKPLAKACRGKMKRKSVEELEAIAEWKKWQLDELEPQCFKRAMEQLQAKKKSSPENPEPDPADN